MSKTRVLLSGDWINEENLQKLKKQKILSAALLELLPELIPILDLFYPDRWDIQLVRENESIPISNELRFLRMAERNRFCSYPTRQAVPRALEYCLYVVIYFPKLTVTNEKSATHNIEELYARFRINNDISIGSLQGVRTKLTMLEYKSRYMFSHLPKSDLSTMDWSNCCLGESELVDTKSRFAIRKELSLLKLFLLQIEGYFQWESLEGVPHVKMQSVGSGILLPSSDLSGVESSEYVTSCIQRIPNLPEAKLRLQLSSNVLRIISDDNLQDLMMNLIALKTFGKVRDLTQTDISGSSLSSLFAYKSEDGVYYTFQSVVDRVYSRHYYLDPEPIVFQRRKIYAQLSSEENNLSSDNMQLVLKPKYLNYAKKRLEAKINEDRIKNYVFKALSSS